MRFIEPTPLREYLWRPSRYFVHTQASDHLIHWASESAHQVALVVGPVGAGKTSGINAFIHDAWHFDLIALVDQEDLTPEEDVVANIVASLRAYTTVPLERVLVVVDDANELLGEDEFARLLIALSRRKPVMRWLIAASSVPAEAIDVRGVSLVPVEAWQPEDARRLLDNVWDYVRSVGVEPFELYEEMYQLLRHIRAMPGPLLQAFDILFQTGSVAAARTSLEEDALDACPTLVLAESQDRDGHIEATPAVALSPILLSGGAGAAVPTTPLLLRSRARGLFGEVLDELESLINSPATREAHLQDFFERYPRILGGVDYVDIVAQPVLQRDAEGPLIPDFMLVPASSQFADILDLKLPSAPLLVGGRNRVRFSSVVNDALAQVREYRSYFDEDSHRDDTFIRYGLRAFRPKVTVVIGRRPRRRDIPQVRRAWDDLPSSVQLVTYDQLLARVRLWDSLSRW